jgi:hypothetical protein
MSERIPIKEKIEAVDQNIRDLWDALDEEQQHALKNELFILNRFISSVKSNNREIQEHFIMTVNEYYNKNWFVLQKHPKLLWLSLCMCSYDGKKSFYHEWIPHSRTTTSENKKVKILMEIYPTKKMCDINHLSKIMTDNEFKELLQDYGWENSEIKKLLK